jgi:hypothetical protein
MRRDDTGADTGIDINIDLPLYDSDKGGWQRGGAEAGLVLVSAVATFGLGFLAYQLFKGAKPMSWDTFPGPFDDNDQIEYAEADGVSDTLTWTLINAHGKKLWTAVEVYDSTGAMRGSAWTIDPGSSSTASVVSSDFPDGLWSSRRQSFWVYIRACMSIRICSPNLGRALPSRGPSMVDGRL